MLDSDFLKHNELDPKQETRNQLLRGRIDGACGAAVIVKNCVAKKLANSDATVLERGKLAQIYSYHDDVRLAVFHENLLKVDENVVICSRSEISAVPDHLWAALFPVPPLIRVLIAENKKLVEELSSIEKGSTVEVLGSGDAVIGRGIVEYKNTLSSLRFGVYYGIRIIDRDYLSEFTQLSCLPLEAEDLPYQCDIVVTIDKIRPKSRNASEPQKYRTSMSVSVNTDDHIPPWLPKSLSHHALRAPVDATARRQASRSLDFSSKITNNPTRLINHLPLNAKGHTSSKSLELPDSSNRRLTRGRACSSLDSDIPVQSRKSGVEDTGGLTEESLVEILDADHNTRYGVIRRIFKMSGTDAIMAEVEMEDDLDDAFIENGYLNDPHCKMCIIPLELCRRDSRFQDRSRRRNTSINNNAFGLIECPSVEGIIPPISADFKEICGKNRGIQGHHNSCYLDATLFSMFAFTSVIDSILYRPRTKHDIPEYELVQRVLRDEIVNPLRKNLYVRADRVMKLRTLLDQLSSVSGLTSEEKDPEEFLNSLLTQILRAEPFLLLSSDQKAFHYQLFVEKDPSLTLPSVQQLLEQSFTASDVKLKQLPSCLIVQMPRFGKAFKMYPRILPSTVLDVTDVIQDSPRQCASCGNLAEMECKDCFISGLEGSSFCTHCLEKAHSHFNRNNHKMRKLAIPVEFAELQEHCSVPRLNMNLFAVVCIETSHYVTFLNTSQGWVFFDSMADRKGEQNGYNIPEIVNCPDLPYWLSEEGARLLEERQDDRDLPELAKRLLCDAYMCMYQSPEVMMYK